MQMPLVLYICDTINVKLRDNPDVIMLNCVSKGGRRTRGGDTPHCRGLEKGAGMIFSVAESCFFKKMGGL